MATIKIGMIDGTLKVSAEVRYCTISASSFIASVADGTPNRTLSLGKRLYNNDGGFGAELYYAPANLPDGAIVTSLKSWGFRDDALASLTVTLNRSTYDASAAMATTSFSGLGGNQTDEDVTIDNATIDNENYQYYLTVNINNNDSVNDTGLYYSVVKYTISKI